MHAAQSFNHLGDSTQRRIHDDYVYIRVPHNGQSDPLSAIQRGYYVPSGPCDYLSKPENKSHIIIDNEGCRLTLVWEHMSFFLVALAVGTGGAKLVVEDFHGDPIAVVSKDATLYDQLKVN